MQARDRGRSCWYISVDACDTMFVKFFFFFAVVIDFQGFVL